MDKKQIIDLTMLALQASYEAGQKILEIYEKAISVSYKTDGSPLTDADNASHDIILRTLRKSEIPVLSEEDKEIPFEKRSNWKYYWLVDPLDGTKEFIKRNGEFTVNIALMEGNLPLSGIVLQPVTGFAHVGIVGDGLYKFSTGDAPILSEKNRLKVMSSGKQNTVTVIASRTHNSPETDGFIESLGLEKKIELLNVGSAVKFCRLAEGSADIYPRFAPTMEWDTAAGQALLKSVGKNIYLYPGGNEMTYNKKQLINDWFIAR